MLLVKSALLSQVLLCQGHVVHRSEVQILVISNNENKVWLAISVTRGCNGRSG
jgi:hypothetical protein